MRTQHTIAVSVQDQPGVLQRVTGLFGRRGFNIDSITVGGCEKPGLSRMIIVTTGDERTLAQVQQQLMKLIDVLEVSRLSVKPIVSRELALIKVQAAPALRPELISAAETFRAAVVDVGADHIMIQAIGDADKIEALFELLRPYGILELSRTGATAMVRGS